MPKLQKVSGEVAIRTLEKLGYKKVRQRGSHVILKKQTPEEYVGCVVPMHKGTGYRHFAWHFETGKNKYR